MFRSDAQGQSADSMLKNIHSITLDVILEIQKDLEPYDMVSLVFLLYNVPDTALQELIVYERISEDVEGSNLNLLYNWALNSQTRPTWKYEFLEALAVCRLYNIIKKLGFNVSNVKKHYIPNNIYVNVYINPIKKVLYRLCEATTKDNFQKLKRTLLQYTKFRDQQTCELLFLELMSNKFISLGNYDTKKKTYSQTFDVEKLAKVIESFDSFKKYAIYLREISSGLTNIEKDENSHTSEVSMSTENAVINSSYNHHENFREEMHDLYTYLDKLHLEDLPIQNLKSDRKLSNKDFYPLNNEKRLGVCCIINQEKFHPSKINIESQNALPKLENRAGSNMDAAALEETMLSLNFDVKKKCNLEYHEIFKFIRDVIKNDVNASDSVFMLCVLSHGVKGHIYSADSLKVKINDIQDILDSDEAMQLRGIPKVFILQACQVDDQTEAKKIKLVADNPNQKYYLKKSHFLIFWATAPELEAYRNEKLGSIFIQLLCNIIKQKAAKEHLSDIFTKVKEGVTTICTKLQKDQVPISESTLVKKLYLRNPNQ